MSYTTGSYYNPPQAPGFRIHTDLTTELGGRILPYGDDVDEFIDDLLPCSTPFTRNDDLSDAFSNYQPGAGREVQECPNVASGFTKLVSQFPDDKQVIIENTHSIRLDFPFDAFKTHHHHTSPDLCVSFPGQPLYRAWQSIAMTVECKGEDWQDPFPKHGDERKRSVKQLAINARNILLAHGALAAFVIGVYGHTVRLARFDHACALVSPAFTIDTDAGKETLQKFLWHFVHPVVGGASSVAGSDPTVMKLTQGDREWIKKELERAKAKNWKDHMCETLKGRRIEVYDDQTGRCVPYLLYHLVDVNARLFSRATMVWRAIEDRRMCSNGRLVEDPTRTSPVKPQIVKEAWRQLLRNSEIMFYQRLYNRIDPEEWVGLAKMVYGGDIGDFERVWWEGMWRRRKVATNTPDAAPEAMLPSGTPSIYSLSSQLFCSTGSSASPLVTSVESPTEYVPRHNFPLGRPQHETYSWRLVFGERAEPLERSHVRMVIDDVGRPVTEFTSTRELVLAVRDAIKGHALALGDARILHRDISVGNILIADEPKPEHETGPTYTGFLHDFDHSRMLYLGPEEGSEQRQGTPYFMACELLDQPGCPHLIRHDLEAYYWVLLWVVIRHTDHGNREDLRHRIFKDGDDAGASAKISWLQDQTEFTIKNHGPLTYLLAELKNLVAGQVLIDGPDNYRPTYITYEMLLDAFDTALDMPGWPTDDHARAYKPVSQGDHLDAPTSNVAQPLRPVLRRGPVKTEGQPPRPNRTDLPPHPGREHRPAPRTLDNPELFVNTPEKRGGPFAAEAPFEIPPFGGNGGPRKRLRTASGVSGQEECGTESRPRKRLRASKTRATAVPPTAKSRRRGKQPPRQGTRVSARQKEIQARKRAQGGAA